MRCTDIDTFISILNSKNDDLIESYVRMIDNDYYFPNKPSIKIKELVGIYKLFTFISSHLTFSQKQSYFCSTKNTSGLIEQFDILRFSEKSILNIEIKSELPKKGLDGVKEQMLKHRQMLSLLNKQVNVYSYIANTNTLYSIQDNVLEIVNLNQLVSNIDQDSIAKCELLDIDLAKMIISPFSQPEDFAKSKYYLNDEQKAIKSEIQKSDFSKFCISGGPGTGKSLILFDLAYHYKNIGKKVVIVFGSMMNDREAANISRIIGIKVIHVKKIKGVIHEYDVIMLDEAQRVWRNIIDDLLNLTEKTVVFALDREQTLHFQEKKIDNQHYITNIANVKSFSLKKRIRTDPVMATFIMKLLDFREKGLQRCIFKNVSVSYFNTKEDAKIFISNMCENHNFTSIELTSYHTKTFQTIKREQICHKSIFTHQAVGREFDNVLIPLDEHFYHDENGVLQSKYKEWYPYMENSMIFQALTRVKKKLVIVVVNNPDIYKSIESILNWKNTEVKK